MSRHRITSRAFLLSDYDKAVAYKEEVGGIIVRTEYNGIPMYEVKRLPPTVLEIEIPLFESLDDFIKYYGEREAMRIINAWVAREREERG